MAALIGIFLCLVCKMILNNCQMCDIICVIVGAIQESPDELL